MSPVRTGKGVTLIELIVVIAITSIIAATVALFIRRPVEGYADAARRAALTDEADTALRRLTRDLRLALPNSVRVLSNGNGTFLEYIETTGGGRYRAERDNLNAGDPLEFNLAAPGDGSFDVLCPDTAPACPSLTFPPGSQIVVYNLYSGVGETQSNAYVGDNRAVVTGFVPPVLSITQTLFPAPSPAKRFHVVSGPVTYGCVGSQLLRYSGYGYSAAQAGPPGGTVAVLANNVAAGGCQFVYTPGALTERIATVSIILQINSISAGGAVERVRLFQQTQVSNAP